jgi:hypothetical protein
MLEKRKNNGKGRLERREFIDFLKEIKSGLNNDEEI